MKKIRVLFFLFMLSNLGLARLLAQDVPPTEIYTSKQLEMIESQRNLVKQNRDIFRNSLSEDQKNNIQKLTNNLTDPLHPFQCKNGVSFRQWNWILVLILRLRDSILKLKNFSLLCWHHWQKRTDRLANGDVRRHNDDCHKHFFIIRIFWHLNEWSIPPVVSLVVRRFPWQFLALSWLMTEQIGSIFGQQKSGDSKCWCGQFKIHI